MSKFIRSFPSKCIRSSGFTLVELLVVIAIIGILSSVVLASLNSARLKANDAAIKANMASIHIEAEVYYNSLTPNSYGTAGISSGSCDYIASGQNHNTLFSADTTVKSALSAIRAITGTDVGNTLLTCSNNIYDAANNLGPDYTVSAILSDGSYWCIDSTGFAGPRAGAISGGDRSCNP